MTPYQQNYRAQRGYGSKTRTATARERFGQAVATVKRLPAKVSSMLRQVVGFLGALALWSAVALIGGGVAIAIYTAPVEWLTLAAVIAVIWAHQSNH